MRIEIECVIVAEIAGVSIIQRGGKAHNIPVTLGEVDCAGEILILAGLELNGIDVIKPSQSQRGLAL